MKWTDFWKDTIDINSRRNRQSDKPITIIK